MFHLEYLGGEIGSNFRMLNKQGVAEIGFSFDRFEKREKKSTERYAGLLSSRYPSHVRVHLHPGLPQNDPENLEEFSARYQAFIMANLDRIATVTEVDRAPEDWVEMQRRAFYTKLDGPLFRPVWHSEDGVEVLESLAAMYPTVAIPYRTIELETTLAMRARNLIAAHGTQFHAVGVANPSNLRAIPFVSASTLGWLGPQLRGETIIWDGSRLCRYPKPSKEQARRRHFMTFQKAGFDPDLIMADDYHEVIAVAIWSLRQLEKAINERHLTLIEGGVPYDSLSDLAANRGEGASQEIEARGHFDVDNTTDDSRHVPTPRDPSERACLPTLNLQTEQIIEQSEHGPVLREVTIPSLGRSTIRRCNTCFVSAQCPAYTLGSECAFHLPIEVRTKDQLRALLQAIIEMQGQRVAFARFSEELNGGFPDPIVSAEMDRLFKLVQQLKAMEENREFIKITAERHATGGVLSALFGDRAAAASALPGGGLNADSTNTLIADSLEPS